MKKEIGPRVGVYPWRTFESAYAESGKNSPEYVYRQ